MKVKVTYQNGAGKPCEFTALYLFSLEKIAKFALRNPSKINRVFYFKAVPYDLESQTKSHLLSLYGKFVVQDIIFNGTIADWLTRHDKNGEPLRFATVGDASEYATGARNDRWIPGGDITIHDIRVAIVSEETRLLGPKTMTAQEALLEFKRVQPLAYGELVGTHKYGLKLAHAISK